MEAKQFQKLLHSLHACSEVRAWAEGKSLREVWQTCERADWLLWLCGKMAGKSGWPSRKEVVLAACACAELALKYVLKGEDRPRRCIEIVRSWANGKVTLDEVREARHAAYAAYAAAIVRCGSAAYAAAYAAAAHAADAAAYAAAYAADASYAAADAAYARRKTLKKMADIVRAALVIPTGEK